MTLLMFINDLIMLYTFGIPYFTIIHFSISKSVDIVKVAAVVVKPPQI